VRMVTFENLPLELKTLIFLKLDDKDKKNAALVSRAWRDVTDQAILWKRWQLEKLPNHPDHQPMKYLNNWCRSTKEFSEMILCKRFSDTQHLRWGEESRKKPNKDHHNIILKEIANLNLLKLDISNIELTLADTDLLIGAMRNTKTVILECCWFNAEQLTAMFGALAKSSIQNLEIEGSIYSNGNDLSPLVKPKILGRAALNLKSLKLSHFLLSQEQLLQFFVEQERGMTKLEELELRSIEKEPFFSLKEGLNHTTNLMKIPTDTFTKVISNLRAASLPRISKEQVTSLFNTLDINDTKLRELEIQDSDLSHISSDQFVRVVNNLEKIGLGNTRVMSGKHLTALMKAASVSTKLKDFSFWSIDDYTDKSIRALGPKKIFKKAAENIGTFDFSGSDEDFQYPTSLFSYW